MPRHNRGASSVEKNVLDTIRKTPPNRSTHPYILEQSRTVTTKSPIGTATSESSEAKHALSVIRNLKQSVDEAEAELSRHIQQTNLLRDIDNLILDGSYNSLEDFFVKCLSRLSILHNLAGRAIFLVAIDNNLKLLKTNEANNTLDSDVALNDRVPKGLLTRSKYPQFFTAFGGARSLYAYPFYLLNNLFGIFIVTDLTEHSGLNNQRVRDSLRGVFRQLEIAYKVLSEKENTRQFNVLWNVFVENALSPHRCFHLLARNVTNFLPTFGPLKLTTPPEVQILIWNEDEKTLTIRASTGAERDITRVPLDSVTGLLIQQDEITLPHVYGDPTDPNFSPHYRRFFGSIRSELAVRLKAGGKTFGVLNLETTTPKAFSVTHIAAIRRVAEWISPIVAALSARLQYNRDSQMAYGRVVGEYLENIGQLFGHDVSSPLAAIRGQLEGLADAIRTENNYNELEERLLALKKPYERVATSSIQFAKYLPSFAQFGPLNLAETVNDVINLINRRPRQDDEKGNSEHIAIEFKNHRNWYVHASQLVKPYVWNVISNSIRHIGEKKANSSVTYHGKITVWVSSGKQPNDSTEYVELHIKDNGPGVQRVELRELQKFKLGTRYSKSTGSGWGLVAAQRYMMSIDGWLSLRSVHGKLFEVIFIFRPTDRDATNGVKNGPQ